MLKYARSIDSVRPIIMQLGISYDEIHRMKDSPDKDVVRAWPLIERKMNREDCRRVILDAGLPEPPKSSCYFCPLLPGKYFKRLAAEDPVLFENAAALEDRMNTRREGKKPDHAGCRPASPEAQGTHKVCIVVIVLIPQPQ